MDRLYKMKAEKTFLINNITIPMDSEFGLQQNRGTKYWYVIQDGSVSGEITGKEIKDMVRLDGEEDEDIGFTMQFHSPNQGSDLYSDLNYTGTFPIKPNQDLRNVFAAYYDSKEAMQQYQGVDPHSTREPSEAIPEFFYTHRDLRRMWINKSQFHSTEEWKHYPNLAWIVNAYGVCLHGWASAEIGLYGAPLYLEMVELDDRYRFYAKVDGLIVSYPMFENYKGEKWNQ